MIPTTSQNRTLEGSLGGQTAKMSVSAENMPHLMNILTDLYSDNELACIREYSTNARDSHIMAGVDKPIRVSLPTPLRQTFEVQDFGLGLSVDEVINTYGSYGASTKRETNDANGVLGLGSKSALTYTNMFTVRAVKNGVLAEVAFYRDEKGGGTIEVIDTKNAGDEGNGVTIKIPTRANSQFKEKALAFYSVWEPGTVEIVGEEIPFLRTRKDALWIADNIVVIPKDNDRYGNKKSFVVMGNVTYPMAQDYDNVYGDRYYFADMGSIEFVPSREALNMTDNTKRQVVTFKNRMSEQAVLQHFQKEINKVKTFQKAYEIFRNAGKYVYANGNLFFKGVYLNESVSVGGYRRGNRPRSWSIDPNLDQKDAWTSEYQIRIDEAEKYLFIPDRPATFSHKAKHQVRKYIEKNNLDKVERVLFMDRPKDTFLHYLSPEVSYDGTVSKITVPKAVRQAAAPKPQPEYIWNSYGDRSYYKRTLPKGKHQFVYYNKYDHISTGNYLEEFPKVVFVEVQTNRVDRFLRDNPKAKHIRTWVKEILSKLDKPTREDHDIIEWNSYKDGWYSRYEKIINDSGVKYDRLEKAKKGDLEKAKAKVSTWRRFGGTISSSARDLFSEFPLLDVSHPEHSALYVKAVIAAGKEA